ncbi:uncharacterized protein VICG_00255 [Vittaforma corneae ATCC 50505]|uniref:Iron hydrogenase large subunit C-terminal domain-containing protein n=1 Tax=Vittaforma corneae (strain ATCC 50505) TaxID=993615 RepID=L2GR00_VITCO|nr:uncharacterized protein VICG_00255 [Vittaforma corneae ATCC 50505]ELA42940.1 hypothetical protein VICG_00255 [Vittaforma corneae ATCC 50505]
MSRFFQTDLPSSSSCIKPDRISLADCLACSGCITASEKESFRVDTSFLSNKDQTYSFILSSQSKENISRLYPEINYCSFEKSLVKFLKEHFSVYKVVDTSYFRKGTEVGISSECPAVVLYVERVFPSLIPMLSTRKTFQQTAADFITNGGKNHAPSIKDHKIVSVMQCYDKKDELRRDNTDISYFLGTKEFYEFLKDKFHPENSIEYEVLPWEVSHSQDIMEVSGIESCINHLNKAKHSSQCGFVELRICKSGCINGPAQLRNSDEVLERVISVERHGSVHFDTEERQFIIPKKRTFRVEW